MNYMKYKIFTSTITLRVGDYTIIQKDKMIIYGIIYRNLFYRYSYPTIFTALEICTISK
jgi:hypothetical protein